MRKDVNDDVAFLIVSCDRYSDLWEAFFTLLSKYWPDKNFNTYLLSNKKNFSWPNLKVINTGEDKSYSDNLSKALEFIQEKWIFLWLEDLFITEKVENNRINNLIEDFKRKKGGYLNLASDMPLSYKPLKDSEFGMIPKGVKYRSAIGATIYRKEVLEKLLIEGASAWELDKSEKSNTLDENFFALSPDNVKQPPIRYLNVLIRGKWAKGVKKFLIKEGFERLLDNRSQESFGSYLYAKIYLFRLEVYKFLKIYWK